jgi:putative GTP pyrophosphokinase
VECGSLLPLSPAGACSRRTETRKPAKAEPRFRTPHKNAKYLRREGEANALAADSSKAQIDKLGDRLREGPVSEEDLRLLDEYRRSFSDAYKTVVRRIRDRFALEPTGRQEKTPRSIIAKLRREKGIRLSTIQDIAGCRVVVRDMFEQNEVVALLSAAFPAAKVVDRREKPSHGYRAVHVIAKVDGRPIEIQVRTLLQALWAEFSERTSDAFNDPLIKYGSGNKVALELLRGSSELVEGAEIKEAKAKLLWALDPGKKAHVKALEDGIEATADTADFLAQAISSMENLKRKRQ